MRIYKQMRSKKMTFLMTVLWSCNAVQPAAKNDKADKSEESEQKPASDLDLLEEYFAKSDEEGSASGASLQEILLCEDQIVPEEIAVEAGMKKGAESVAGQAEYGSFGRCRVLTCGLMPGEQVDPHFADDLLYHSEHGEATPNEAEEDKEEGETAAGEASESTDEETTSTDGPVEGEVVSSAEVDHKIDNKTGNVWSEFRIPVKKQDPGIWVCTTKMEVHDDIIGCKDIAISKEPIAVSSGEAAGEYSLNKVAAPSGYFCGDELPPPPVSDETVCAELAIPSYAVDGNLNTTCSVEVKVLDKELNEGKLVELSVTSEDYETIESMRARLAGEACKAGSSESLETFMERILCVGDGEAAAD